MNDPWYIVILHGYGTDMLHGAGIFTYITEWFLGIRGTPKMFVFTNDLEFTMV